MWLDFILGFIACAAFVYCPGYLLLRAFGFANLRSLLIAPVASLASYCLLGIAWSHLGVQCSWLTVMLPLTGLYFVLFIARRIHDVAREAHPPEHFGKSDWITLLIYVGVGIVIAIYVYLVPLGDPNGFLEEYDNAFHMQAIRALADSGNWSVLDISKYMTPDDRAITPLPGAGFYPALWHILCASIVSLLGCSVALALNVVNFTMVSVIFPAAVMMLVTTIFSEMRTARFGSLCALAFAAFPWLLLYWGPLYSNVIGFVMVPIAASLFIVFIDSLLEGTFRLRVLCAFVLSVLVLAVAQPSAVFLCVIILTPYATSRIWTSGKSLKIAGRVISSKLLAVLFVIFVIAVWTGFVFAPFMYNVVFGFNWIPTLTLWDAIYKLATLSVGWIPSQYLLAAFVLIGIVFTCRHREHLWLTVSYLLLALIFIICTSTDGFVRHYFSGFWYTDSFRIFACFVMMGIPLATLGLASTSSFVCGKLQKHGVPAWAVIGVLVTVFCIFVYRPGVWVAGTYVDSAFGKLRWEFEQGNDHERPILFDDDEQRFVEKVLALIPEGEVVANIPDDGSSYAYGAMGLRTYYRDYQGYEDEGEVAESDVWELPESKIIRTAADQLATREDVRKAFESLGIRYVLVLDYGDAMTEQPHVLTYDEALWTGLLGLRDDTPGYSVVLSEGDMRLYEIVSP